MYFKYRRFKLINGNNGYFISRLKQNANLVIIEELLEGRGDAIRLKEGRSTML